MGFSHEATFFVLVALTATVAQLAYYSKRLPDRMASHFDIHRKPDNWLGKGAFLGVYAATQIGLGLLAALVVPLVTPTLYYMVLVFELVFRFNARPAQERLSGMIWVYTVVLVVATVGMAFLLPG